MSSRHHHQRPEDAEPPALPLQPSSWKLQRLTDKAALNRKRNVGVKSLMMSWIIQNRAAE